MSDNVRLCMIGAGGHASRNIYPCFGFLEGVEVVANCDLDAAKASRLATSYGIPASYTDYHEMLEKEKPDGVVVCVGADFHASAAIDIMRLGFHVYTEKPPAVDAAQCREVLAVQKETGRICMTAFKKRYAPAYVKTRALAERDDFGEPALLAILRTSANYAGGENPSSRYLLESAIHVIDLASFLFGHVRSVSAVAGPPWTYSVSMEFMNGAAGTLSLTDRMSYERGWELVTMIGTDGICVEVDNSVEMLAFKYGEPIAAHKPEFVAGSSHSSVEMGFIPELKGFADSVRRGETPRSNIAESVHTMEILEAIGKSLEGGRREKVRDEG